MESRSTENLSKVRNFLLYHRGGSLSTISLSHKGYPFGSVVPYDINEANEIVIFVSRISEHFKNLTVDSRASLLVVESRGAELQSQPRGTILLRFGKISNEKSADITRRYFSRFPSSPAREIASNFVFFSGKIEHIRWIGGFGVARWISGNELPVANFDPIAYQGQQSAERIDENVRESLRKAFRETFTDARSEGSPEIKYLDQSTLRVSLGCMNARFDLELRFLQPLSSIEDLASAIVTAERLKT